MKNLTLILVMSIFISTNYLAQNSTECKKNDLWAIQFQIQENFKLSSLDGTTISLKRKLADNTAIRIGVDLNSQINNEETSHNSQTNSPLEKTFEEDDINLGLGLSVIYQFQNDVINDFSFFYGLGPTVSLHYYNSKITHPKSSYSTENQNKNTINQYGLGLVGCLGVEWFVKENLSIIGEYKSFATYNIFNQKISSTDSQITIETETKKNNFTFGSGSVRLGVSFYF